MQSIVVRDFLETIIRWSMAQLHPIILRLGSIALMSAETHIPSTAWLDHTTEGCLFGIVLWIPLLTGCGNSLASVQGTITLDGKPIAGSADVRGTVTYYPKQGNGIPAVGIINPNGRYEMSTVSEVGVPPGSYDVAVSATRIIVPEPGATPSGRPITPRRYASSKESNLHAEVQSGDNTIDFELSSK